MPRQSSQSGSRKTIKKVNRINNFFKRDGVTTGKMMPKVNCNSHRLKQFVKK